MLRSHWKLRDEDARSLIGGMSNGSFYQLKRSSATNLGVKTTGSKALGVKTPSVKSQGVKTLDQDKLTRVSLLVGIFKALNILYSSKLADTWVQLPNSNRSEEHTSSALQSRQDFGPGQTHARIPAGRDFQGPQHSLLKQTRRYLGTTAELESDLWRSDAAGLHVAGRIALDVSGSAIAR